MNNKPHILPSGYILNENFRVKKLLREGGFGITYLCKDMLLNTNVAIKECYPRHLLKDRTVEKDNPQTAVITVSGSED